MFNIFLLKKKEKLLNVPILITAGGQSLMAGFMTQLSWLTANHPEALGVQENIYIHSSLNITTNEIQTLNVGVNQNCGINVDCFGPMVPCSIMLRDYFNIPVYLAFYAVGSTQLYDDASIMTWNVNEIEEYYYRLTLRTNQMIQHMNSTYGVGNWRHLAFCWQQGENDNDNSVKVLAYADNEYDLVNTFRTEYGNLPFVSGGVWSNTNHVPNGNINQRKIYNQSRITKYYYTPCNDLTVADAATHLDSPSQWENGTRYFNILKQQ